MKKKKRDEKHLSSVLSSKNGLFAVHSLTELVYASAGVYELLLACVERMTLRANVYMKTALRRYCLKSLAACALYSDFRGLGMNSFFHCLTSHQKFGAYLLC